MNLPDASVACLEDLPATEATEAIGSSDGRTLAMAQTGHTAAITEERIAAIAERAPGVPRSFLEAPREAPIARGVLDVRTLRDGVTVMGARLRGVRPVVTDAGGGCGLFIEARLTGASTSTSHETPPRHIAIGPASMHVLGAPTSVRWRVRMPAQPSLDVVTVRFPPSFFKAMTELEPRMAATLEALIERRICRRFDLSPAAAQAAMALLDNLERSDATLVLEARALDLLSTALPYLAPRSGGGSVELACRLDALLAQTRPHLWTLNELGEQLGVSTTRLKRAVQLERGVSAGAYLADRRMDRARAALSASRTVCEAAVLAGYATPEAFAKAFKRRFSLSPSAFRGTMAAVRS